MNHFSNLFFALCLLFCTTYTAWGQTNLVPNPSFEDTTACPGSGEGYIENALGWSSYGSSPDLFHTCNQNKWGLPNNIVGYQYASSGNAYAGFIAYDKNIPHTDKEFIGRTLSQSLTVGQKYFVSIKVNLPRKDTSTTNQIDCDVFACNKLGILFSTVSYNEFTPPPKIILLIFILIQSSRIL